MRTVRRRIAAALLAGVACAGCDGSIFGGDKQFDFAPLEFPLAAPSDIERIAAFGTLNWSGTEPHNGTDLIVHESLSRTKILSPTNGTVRSVRMSENPYSHPPNQALLSVEILVNDSWTVTLVFEPGTADAGTRAAQTAAIQVREDREVAAGDEIGDLVVGELGYPHLHYMVQHDGDPVCAYSHSSATARSIFDGIAARSGSRICL